MNLKSKMSFLKSIDGQNLKILKSKKLAQRDYIYACISEAFTNILNMNYNLCPLDTVTQYHWLVYVFHYSLLSKINNTKKRRDIL